MNIVNNNCTSLTASINGVDISTYLVARIKIKTNCCDKVEFYEIQDLENTSDTDPVYLENNTLVINPEFFEAGLIDAVYTIEITLYTSNGSSVADTGCFFLDCKTKCKVAEYIKTLSTEEEKTRVLMEHYSLSVSSSCSCDCDSLCTIFKSLQEKLINIKDEDCGCM